MKICVLGAGVIGVSAAFALARDGHNVHVIDRAERTATGTSAANGAQVSYSHVDPFASPATLRQLPAYLSGLDPAVRLGLSLKPDYLGWGLRFIRECGKSRSKDNLLRRAELAHLSRRSLDDFAADCGSRFPAATGIGKIVLAGSKSHLERMEMSALEKTPLGVKSNALARQECLTLEPALKDWQGNWAGGLHAPGDNALDPIKYCDALKETAETRYGAKFHFGETIQSVKISDGTVKAVQTDKAIHTSDRIVVCLGVQANDILREMGLAAPIYPVQGYSLTLPATETAPKISLTDLNHKIVFANLGKTIRIAGFMDTNQRPSKAAARGQQLLDIARRLWPSIADYDANPHHWTHFRPMVPSGVPIIRESKISGLYLNIGHGSLGYTFAAGSAMIIAGLIAQDDGLSQPHIERKKFA